MISEIKSSRVDRTIYLFVSLFFVWISWEFFKVLLFDSQAIKFLLIPPMILLTLVVAKLLISASVYGISYKSDDRALTFGRTLGKTRIQTSSITSWEVETFRVFIDRFRTTKMTHGIVTLHLKDENEFTYFFEQTARVKKLLQLATNKPPEKETFLGGPNHRLQMKSLISRLKI